MRSLYNAITERTIYDGHIHLFDEQGGYDLPWVYGVGFADWNVLNPQDGVLFEKYGEYQDLRQTFIMLATAPTPEETIKIHDVYNLDGYGEIKMYDEYQHNGKIHYLSYKDIDYWTPVFEEANRLHQPVYIHYTIKEKQDALFIGKMCERWPNARFVLCHLGMDSIIKDEYLPIAAENAVRLAIDYPNLWLDASWEGLEYLLKNPTCAPYQKLILGSDLNPNAARNWRGTFDNCKENLIYANRKLLVDNESNIRKLFDR